MPHSHGHLQASGRGPGDVHGLHFTDEESDLFKVKWFRKGQLGEGWNSRGLFLGGEERARERREESEWPLENG